MSHALVVGGSGMLAEASLALIQSYDTVSVIARYSARLNRLTSQSPKISALSVDYKNQSKLLAALCKSIADSGPIDLALCWIHTNAPTAPIVIADLMEGCGHTCNYFHLLGSQHADPSRGTDPYLDKFVKYKYVKYKQIVTGFIVEQGNSRWLTDSEISQGCLKAIREDLPYSVIGAVRPWEKRP